MAKPTAPRVMSGTHGIIYLDGEPVWEVSKFEAKLKVDREDIQFAGDMTKNSKLMAMSGEWSATLKKVYSRGATLIASKIKDGVDPRFTIIGKVDDPDAYGSERVTLYDCWSGDVTLMNFETGKVIEEELSGGFSDFDFPDVVSVQ